MMNKETKNRLVPKLRFPEFIESGEWEEKALGNVCKFIRGPFGGALKKEIFVNDGYAVYEQSHAIYNKFVDFRYYITEEKFQELKRFSVLSGDIIMSCSGTMGKFAIVPPKYKRGVINQALLKLTVKKEHYIKYIKSVLELPINQEQILSQAGGGAIKNVASVSILKEIKVHIPKDPKEQQKISDCLSSLDELISAESQKHEALKAHKKGLMQQLFPAEGEKEPKLRFPEFRGSGEWEESLLERICYINPTTKKLPFRFIYIDLESVQDGVLLQKKEISLNDSPSRAQRLLKKDDIIFQMVRPYQKNNYFYNQEDKNIGYVASTGYAQIRAFQSKEFLFQYLHNDRFVQRVLRKCTGTNYPAISSKDLSKIKIEIPKQEKEQNKIAGCLSSIDKQISKQNQKIEELKNHKKGLMQNLFPNPGMEHG